MICPNYPDPQFFIFSKDVPALLYYSHLPAIIISLLLGCFVYFKNRFSLASKVLLSISVVFSLWTFINLITWTNNNSQLIMFVWTFFQILYAMLCILCLYFVYVFIDKKDLSLKVKTVLGILFLPVAILAPTAYNIRNFSLELCGAVNEGVYYNNYCYGVGFLMFLWILVLLISRYRKAEKEMKKQIILLGFGIELFLLSFFTSGYIASLLTENSYNLEFYGLFGMTFFMAMLAYLIVQFQAFHIKLLGAQALVVSLVILIGSQFFFADSPTSIVLTGVTLALSLGFGYMLIKSVLKENERKEQLQVMADKLAVANDELRKLDNAKTEFISIASHQLRTPLTAIKGFLSLILEGTYGDINTEVRGALDKVYLSGEHLIQLVEDLLNVSRIESGRMQFTFAKGDLADIVKELYANFTLVAKVKNLYLELKLPKTNLPEIIMDKGKVREVVSNLIDNALKYSERGGVTVTAEIIKKGMEPAPKSANTASSEKGAPIDGDVIRLTVSDTGVGIPAEEMPYLFKKFSRGKDVARLHVGGTGLGIYVAKNIMEAHKGRVWVESEGAGMGSRFIMELPISS